MAVVAIIQARMGSHRLPGKVLMDIHGRPMIEHVVRRVRRARGVEAVVLATSTLPGDDALAEWAAQEGVACFRGSEDDVLARYHAAAREHAADTIIRITGDCPVICPGVIARVLAEHAARPRSLAYTSNVLERTYARGMDTEVFGRDALERAHLEAQEPADREHVTRFMVLRPQVFNHVSVRAEHDTSGYRLTVDEPADLALVRALLERVPEDSAYPAVLAAMTDERIASVNENVKQKVV